ncbi:MAG: asparagine synthase (glutamine-hydrolyzing) [Paracoccaceae bacterium]|nr:asparagine synthase (glutamine-hydrolyzing) [Paracoccaceae bacterium]
MCGIVGFTSPGGNPKAILSPMMSAIAYRGPDESGTYADDRIAVGHLRLTIIEPDGGHQPRVDDQTGDLLVYNGEIYGYRAHADWLRGRGVALRDGSDTEVLFQMIRHLGIDEALERLDGMFAFAYRDGATGTLWLARDRFGEKPLFYARRGDRLIFGSEVKALLAHPDLRGCDFDHAALAQYLAFDYVPAPATGLDGIEKLAPGEVLTLKSGQVERRTYWLPNLPSAGGPAAAPSSIDEQADRLTGLLDRSIESRLIADVPVGLFLSGGLDSALIAARASKLAPEITAYTIRFEGGGYDETPFAAEVANHFGLRHRIFDVGKDELFSAIGTIEARMDEPFADSSIVPTYLLCRAARQDVTVALGGDGGDELFAGYINFQAQAASPLLRAMPKALKGLPRAASRLLPAHDDYMSSRFKIDQLLNAWGEQTRYQSFQWMSAFDAAEIGALMSQDDGLVAAIDRELAQSHPTKGLEQQQYLFCRLYLPNAILTKVDRASMYNSLEVRAPFLARPLAEFAFSLPGPMKLRRLETKRILRHLGRRLLPTSVTERAKHGFALPVASLIRGPLSELVSDTLLDESNPLADFVSRAGIEQTLADHRDRRRDNRKRIWALYCLFQFARNVRTLQTAPTA